ncbi:EamA family transporter [Candidatus Dojkabacteria bacterium]|nr:EamA family transporter [Candidatus Dojkabacteria bacterium]
MNETIQAIILAVVAMFGFGISNGISKKYAQAVGPLRLITYPRVLVVGGLFILSVVSWQNVTFDWKYIGLGIFTIAISYFGLFFFNKSIEVGKVGVAVPVTAGRIIISAMVGVMFLEDSLNLLQFMSIFLVTFGIALLSLDFRQLKNSNILNIESGVPYAVLAALFWGASMPFFGYFGNKVGVVFFAFLTELTVFSQSIVHTKLRGMKVVVARKRLKENITGLAFIGVCTLIASLSVTAGFATGKVGIVAAISGSSPVISVLVARLLFKELLEPKQYIAIFLVVAGIVGTSVF